MGSQRSRFIPLPPAYSNTKARKHSNHAPRIDVSAAVWWMNGMPSWEKHHFKYSFYMPVIAVLYSLGMAKFSSHGSEANVVG